VRRTVLLESNRCDSIAMEEIAGAAFSRRNIFEKLWFVATMFSIVPWLILGTLCHAIWKKLNPQKLPNRKMQKISEILYVIEGYGPVPVTTRMLIFRNIKTNKVALVSPLRPEDATVAEVRSLGEVDAIIVPSLGHDSFTPAWAKLFPNARLAAPAACKDMQNKVYARKDRQGFQLNLTQEEILLSYPGVLTHTPPPGCISTGEDMYEVLNDDGSKTLATFDLQVNNDWSTTWFPNASGFGGHRTARMFKLVFVENPLKFRTFMLNVVCSIPRVSRVIFAHGHILEGNDVCGRIASAVTSDF